MKKYFFIAIIFALGNLLPSCKGTADKELKANAEAALKTNPVLSGVTVAVNEGVAALSGKVSKEEYKAVAEQLVLGIKNINDVENNIAIGMDAAVQDQLTDRVREAIKDYSTISAIVSDSVIILTGTLKKDNMPYLIKKVEELHPKQVVTKNIVLQ
jgi:hyperosmotically inducible periplasmic protein